MAGVHRRDDSFRASDGDESGGAARTQFYVRATGQTGRETAAPSHRTLGATVADMERALKPGGVSAHLVDLRSHGLHRDSPLDFLCWPEWMWQMMYSHKGVPNRLRPDAYRRAIANTSLVTVRVTPTRIAERREIERVRPKLARRFRNLSDEDLSWLGFWMVLEKPISGGVARLGNGHAAS